MVYKGFEIYKVRAYVWRLYCLARRLKAGKGEECNG